MSQHVSTYAREYGLPIIGIAQNPSEINPVFLNNVAASITFRLGADEALQMKDLGDYRYRVMRLAEREVVMQLKHRYLEPLVGSTFSIPPEMLENITDAELAVLMKDEWSRLEQLRTYVLEQSVATSTSDESSNAASQQPEEKRASQDKQPATEQTLDAPDPKLIMVLLKIYYPDPYLFSNEYIEVADQLSGEDSISKGTLAKRFKELVAKGYLIRHEIGRLRGKGIAFEADAKARAFFSAMCRYPYNLKLLHGSGYLHSFEAYRVQRVLKARYPKAEVTVSDTDVPKGSDIGECDVVCRNPDGLIDLFEIDRSAKNMDPARIEAFLKIDSARSLTILVPNNKLASKQHLAISDKVKVEPLHVWMLTRAELEKEKENNK